LPGMKSAPLPADEVSAGRLAQTLKGLKLSPPSVGSAPAAAARVSGRTYTFGKNNETLHSLTFDFKANTLTYRFLGGNLRRGSHSLDFGSGAWVEGIACLGMPAPKPVTASGSWMSDDTIVLTICYYETPFMATLTCRFDGGQVYIDQRVNVAFGPTERPQLVGNAVSLG